MYIKIYWVGDKKTDIVNLSMSLHIIDHLGTENTSLCEQYIKFIGLAASGFDFPFCTRPHALWQQPPPELVLIP